MPNRDGTGPDGKGPRTGRGLGNCPPVRSTQEAQDRPIRRRRRRRGRNRDR